MLERYTGSPAKEFPAKHIIILTNFEYYMERFSKRYNAALRSGSAMRAAHSKSLGVSIVDFKIGSPTAALVIEMLSAIKPDAVFDVGNVRRPPPSISRLAISYFQWLQFEMKELVIHFMPSQVPALTSI